MNILITGGAGFIGSHLVDHFLETGSKVQAVDDLSTGNIANLAAAQKNPNFQFFHFDIMKWPGLEKAVGWADVVFHMAAIVGVKRVLEDSLNVIKTNCGSSELILEAALKLKAKPRIIMASSSEVYGFNPKPAFAENDDLVLRSDDHFRWCYTATKLMDEFVAQAYAMERDVPVTSVRLFNTVGPRQRGMYGMVVPNFVRQAVSGSDITVFGDGNQTRSFCDVRDMVSILTKIAESDKTIGKIINAGNDQEITIHNLAKKVREIAESASKIKFIEYAEAYGRPFTDVDHRRPDLSELKRLISFEHKWKLDDTLKELVAFESENVKIGIPAE
ncbi:MAG: NAD-dependent epimerase/dehydratase family protein [Sphingomonadales bacterium]